MNKVQTFVFGAAVLSLSALLALPFPMSTYAEGRADGSGGYARRPGMHGMFGAGAPLIGIALRHKTELALSADQVATLEKIRAHHRDQTTPIREQLRSVEGEITSLAEETPANLIQIKLKIEEAEKLRSALRYLRVEALENGKSVLTATQRDQLKGLTASPRGFRKPRGQTS